MLSGDQLYSLFCLISSINCGGIYTLLSVYVLVALFIHFLLISKTKALLMLTKLSCKSSKVSAIISLLLKPNVARSNGTK